MSKYEETVEKGFQSLNALTEQIEDVVDAMRRDGVPIWRIGEYLHSKMNAIIAKNEMLQEAGYRNQDMPIAANPAKGW